ncbi:hypothetical protein XA68_18398 [Ophiocordyceps unilateralis]|uniref:DUF5672 domain-containing protein n=1 Tax=Ophiocordyceps unilateralis TaxID=268505 RepID=A0A2A9PJH1_OPHUN|nr:hypothetical protein XA68_18398 [Ophiocordyceps unilateralis]
MSRHPVHVDVSSRIHEARRRFVGSPGAGPALNGSKVALLMEPRPLPHLVPLVTHMMSVVPLDWHFLFLGSPWSVYSLARSPAIKHQQTLGKMSLRTLPKPWNMDTPEDVFRLLTDSRFYHDFLPGVEWVLNYHHDSILCANSPTSLDDWLEWSWAGAARSDGDGFPGAGGLTLRRLSAVRRVLAFQNRLNDSEPEGDWFCKRLSAMPGEKVSPTPFAVRDVWSDRPMGYQLHAAVELGPWSSPEVRRKTLEYCPELAIILDMKLERERCPDDDGHGGRLAVDGLS